MKEHLVSIILPVRNEEKFIEACLRSITTQDYPADKMELLIIDGRSNDSTVHKIEEFRIQNSELNIQIIENPKKVVSAGLNLGIKAARGDAIIRMDAHAEYGRGYIKQCLIAMEKSGAANVGGPALALPGGKGLMAEAITLAHYSPFGLGGGQFRNPDAEGYVETVWPGCFRREVFDKVGYIDERRTRTEDIEFNTRLKAAGYKIYISPLIKAYYYCRTGLKETWRQRWADGYEITHFLPDNPKAPRLRHFIPLAFVVSLLGLALIVGVAAISGQTPPYHFDLSKIGRLSAGTPRSGEGLVVLGTVCLLFLVLELGAYVSAMLFFVGKAGRSVQRTAYSGKAKEPLSSNNYHLTTKSIALLPIVFLTLHFSYGLGSIWGLITLAGWAKKRNE